MEGSGLPRFSVIRSHAILERIVHALPLVFGGAVIAILVSKLLLAWRININWDEFYYLSHVHALTRGELDLLLQTAYTQVFQWVVTVGPNEVDQVVSARLPMCLLLALSAWLLYRLARCWVSVPAAAFAVLAFIGSWPALQHGASFRVDSMLLPLSLGALLMVVRPSSRRVWSDAAAGLCLGTAFALTIKTALLLPVLLAMVLLADGTGTRTSLARSIRSIAIILAIAVVVFALLIGIHSTQVVAGAESAGSVASRSVMATLMDVPLLPRGGYFRKLIMEDVIFWLAVPPGLLVALTLRNYRAAAAVLTLLPILFYRNAFPYYYPLMMAPAAILVALAADWLLGVAPASRHTGTRVAALAVLGLLLMHDSWDGLMTLRFDEQGKQRAVVAAVHQVFPEPVPYIDHGGMIASFPKVNFFMSTWGIEHYLQVGRDFMPAALATRRPPLLLVNHFALHVRSRVFRQLREVDRKLLTASYVDYWGPIRVAGVEATIPAGQAIRIRPPFPGWYRVESGFEVVVDGRSFKPGDTLEVLNSSGLALEAAASAAAETKVRLIWAAAQPPPTEPPPTLPLYAPL